MNDGIVVYTESAATYHVDGFWPLTRDCEQSTLLYFITEPEERGKFKFEYHDILQSWIEKAIKRKMANERFG